MPEEHSIPSDAIGKRLDHVLAALYPGHSRSQLQAWIKEGRVLLDGKATKPSEKIRSSGLLSVSPPEEGGPVETRPEEIPLDILYEDDDLLILNKAAGMVVHPAAGNPDGTLVNALLHHCGGTLSTVGGEDRPGIVHRLDKETSGIMVVAKNNPTHEALAAQFQSRDVTKIYLAIASGTFRESSGTIEVEMGRHPVNRKKMAVLPVGTGRHSKTEWRFLRELKHGTLVECLLHTGRTHQIRVHLKHIGHPLMGDALYGKRGPYARQMLHAWKLGFIHPRTGKRLDFESPIPEDFLKAGATPPFNTEGT